MPPIGNINIKKILDKYWLNLASANLKLAQIAGIASGSDCRD
jgi:hypothetical protein